MTTTPAAAGGAPRLDLLDPKDPTVDDTVDNVVDNPVDETAVPARRPRTSASPARVAELENEGEIAADYLEGLLDIADLDGDIDMDVEGDRAMVSIVGGDLDDLVGRGGEVLDALQG
jgi:spoIIIJ-associated protein